MKGVLQLPLTARRQRNLSVRLDRLDERDEAMSIANTPQVSKAITVELILVVLDSFRIIASFGTRVVFEVEKCE